MANLAQDTQALLDLVSVAGPQTDAALLEIVVSRIAAKRREEAFWARMEKLAKSPNPADHYGLNVLSASLWGVLVGGTDMKPLRREGTVRVNPFLHGLRRAILKSADTASLAKTRARNCRFYPEFDAVDPAERVVDAALAHSAMGPSDEELTVLYSLGGYFDWDAAGSWRSGVGKGPTTCVMTARGIYCAAGLKVIGNKEPTVGTPLGADDALGVPDKKYSAKANKNVTVTTVGRGDRQDIGPSGYNTTINKLEDPKPYLRPGAIYLVMGEQGHEFLLRGGGAWAAHVGVVTRANGDSLDTVDGGNGLGGGSVYLTKNREMINKPGVGWTFKDSSRSYGAADFKNLEVDMAPYMDKADTTMLDAYIQSVPSLRKQWVKIETDIAQLKRQVELKAPNADKRLAMQRTQYDVLREQARTYRRMTFASTKGEQRTIQGWWRPEQYSELDAVDRFRLQMWTAQWMSKSA